MIKGYQLENERLYGELKSVKESARKAQKKYEEEIQKLRCDLIQEKLGQDKKSVGKSQDGSIALAPLPMNEQPNKFLPSAEESKLQSVSAFEEELRRVRFDLNASNERTKLLADRNTDLLKRLEYYEKNQQQIELDVKVIESKNREIKRLGDRLKALESGRTPPDCLRQIKQLTNQLAQMDSLVKRYKKPSENGVKAANAIAVANMTLEYYENRINRLEEQLKDKTYEVERLSRMWEQKYVLVKEVYDDHIRKLSSNHLMDERPTRDRDSSAGQLRRSRDGSDVRRSLSLKRIDAFDLDRKLNEIEAKYMMKCDELENTNKNLRKVLEEFELRVDEKTRENEQMKLDYAKLVAELQSENESRVSELRKKGKVSFGCGGQAQAKRSEYEPSMFRASSSENLNSSRRHSREDNSEALRQALNECARLNSKLSSLQYDMKLRDQQNDANRLKTKQAFENKLNLLGQKHRNEMEVLVKTLTGTSGLMMDEQLDFTNEWDSPLKDPMRMKYLFKARDNFEQLKQTINAQKQTIRDLTDRCSQLGNYKSRCMQLEEQEAKFREELAYLREQLEAKKSSLTPEMRDYEELKEKLRQIEEKNQRRERDLGQLLGTGSLTSSTSNLNEASGLVKHYEKQLMLKNQEIEKFRSELDSMLQLLQTLQMSA